MPVVWGRLAACSIAVVTTDACIFQDMVEEETRGKLSAQAKFRQEQDEKESLRDRLEEEEEAKKSLEKQVQDLQQKVFLFCLY